MPARPIPNRLLHALDVLLLEGDGKGSFHLVGEAPAWVQRLWPEAVVQRQHLRPTDAFLFLEHFMPEAEAVWAHDTGRSATSEMWTEVDSTGREWILEAQALRIDGRRLLLLRFPAVAPENLREVLQQSRELNLEHYRLLKEIDRREVMLHCLVHDLSTPLAAIRGSLRSLAEDEMVEDEGQPLVNIGLRQVEKMRRMIGEMLSAFTERQAAPAQEAGTPPDLGAALHELTTGLAPAAQLKNVQFCLEASPEDQTDWRVVGEATRLERVLFNLLENALRHAPPGSDVGIRMIDEGPAIHVSIEDRGAGVAEEEVSRLFRKFAQGQGKTGQVGLGLYFCRITIEGWGGAIGYEPAEPGGARFWFRLPKHLEPVSPTNGDGKTPLDQ